MCELQPVGYLTKKKKKKLNLDRFSFLCSYQEQTYIENCYNIFGWLFIVTIFFEFLLCGKSVDIDNNYFSPIERSPINGW